MWGTRNVAYFRKRRAEQPAPVGDLFFSQFERACNFQVPSNLLGTDSGLENIPCPARLAKAQRPHVSLKNTTVHTQTNKKKIIFAARVCVSRTHFVFLFREHSREQAWQRMSTPETSNTLYSVDREKKRAVGVVL